MERSQATSKRRENQEEHILLGMKMMSPHQALHFAKSFKFSISWL